MMLVLLPRILGCRVRNGPLRLVEHVEAECRTPLVSIVEDDKFLRASMRKLIRSFEPRGCVATPSVDGNAKDGCQGRRVTDFIVEAAIISGGTLPVTR